MVRDFDIAETQRITGLTARQLRHWDNTGLLQPEHTGRSHSRKRWYSFSDLVALRALRRLRNENVSVQKIRKAFGYLRRAFPELADNLSGIVFIVYGFDLVALAPGEEFPVSTVRAQGQHVMQIPVEEVRTEVAAAVRALDQAV